MNTLLENYQIHTDTLWNICVGIPRQIFPIEYALVVSIGKYQHKYSLSIYRENYSEKKTNKYDDMLFLYIELPTNLSLSINESLS